MKFIYSKIFIGFAVVLVLVFILLFLQNINRLDTVKKFFLYLPRPVVFVSRAVARPTKNFFSTLFQLKKIVGENSELAKQNSLLSRQLAEVQSQALENETLRRELGFKKTTKMELVPCNILAGNIYNSKDAVTLDCGQEEGVKAGQAIISSSALVGKVVYASKNLSTGILATNSDFLVDARLSKSGVPAVVKGSYGSGVLLEQIPQEASVEEGEMVVSAGINERIPKNLIIGQVGKIFSNPNDLFKKASLKTQVEIKYLDFVFVIKN